MADTEQVTDATKTKPVGSLLLEFRGVIVAVVGLIVLMGVAVVALTSLPASIPSGATDTKKGESIVAIASAVATAVGSLVAAYFGVRSANAAREESGRALERAEITASRVTGHLEPEVAATALGEAATEIRARRLSGGR